MSEARWISVKEQKPDESMRNVLVLCSVTKEDEPEFKAKKAVFLRREFVYEGSKRKDQGYTEEVKYWLPLPKPPEDV